MEAAAVLLQEWERGLHHRRWSRAAGAVPPLERRCSRAPGRRSRPPTCGTARSHRRLPSPRPSTCSGSQWRGCRRSPRSTLVRRMARPRRVRAPHRCTPRTRRSTPGSTRGWVAAVSTQLAGHQAVVSAALVAASVAAPGLLRQRRARPARMRASDPRQGGLWLTECFALFLPALCTLGPAVPPVIVGCRGAGLL